MSTEVDGSTYERYARYLSAELHAQAIEALASGQRVILGLRRPTNTHANSGRGVYDDTIVVLWNDGAAGSALEFVGNTDPSAYYEDAGAGSTVDGRGAAGADADGDGTLDLGRIPAGIHRYRRGTSTKFGDHVLRSIGAIRAERDVQHDGDFDADDAAAAANSDALMVTDFLFHAGLADRTGSAGCQTMAPEVFEQFWEALGEQDEFYYVLVEI